MKGCTLSQECEVQDAHIYTRAMHLRSSYESEQHRCAVPVCRWRKNIRFEYIANATSRNLFGEELQVARIVPDVRADALANSTHVSRDQNVDPPLVSQETCPVLRDDHFCDSLLLALFAFERIHV